MFHGVPRRTRTTIGRLGGDCSILLSYEHIFAVLGFICIVLLILTLIDCVYCFYTICSQVVVKNDQILSCYLLILILFLKKIKS